MIDTKSVVVAPAPPKASSPQIIVIPQSMLVANGMKTIFSLANNNSSSSSVNSTTTTQKRPLVTKVIKPAVPILQKPTAPTEVITLKRTYHDSSCSGSDDDSVGHLDENGARVRKRANLDHLTQEEKMMRRKLKNRVAAQNARDKKRMKMDDMEVTIRQLQQQNRQLARQNEELMAANRRLEAENESLKAASGCHTVTVIKDEEEQMPYSPESLPPTVPTPPPSFYDDFDEDNKALTAPMLSIHTTTLDVPQPKTAVSAVNRNSSSDSRSLVSNRLLVPAVPTLLQQQGQSRSGAGQRRPSTPLPASTTTSPEQLACLLWTCLLGPLSALQQSSQQPQQQQSIEDSCPSSISSENNHSSNSLPPKKRGQWWGSHQPSPHAKT